MKLRHWQEYIVLSRLGVDIRKFKFVMFVGKVEGEGMRGINHLEWSSLYRK